MYVCVCVRACVYTHTHTLGFSGLATTPHSKISSALGDVMTWPRFFRAFHFRDIFKGTQQRQLTDAVGQLYPHLAQN